MAKIVNIEWIQPTLSLQCPHCSAAVLNDNGKVVKEPCQHFLFKWDSQQEDFEDFSVEAESVLDDPTSDIEGPLDERLLSTLPDSSVLYLSLIHI